MDIDTGMTPEAREASVRELKRVLGETYALYVKTHGYHWNVTGPRFQALHALFETHYRELWAALDILAERIRALGAFAPGSTAEMLAEATIKPENAVPDAEAMIANLVRGHEAVARAAKAGIGIAEQGDDAVTADLLTQRADISEKPPGCCGQVCSRR